MTRDGPRDHETLIDRPGSVREEDAFDLAAVMRFLDQHGVALRGEPVVGQFPGGASNLTFRLQFADRDLILRRPPSGTKAKGAHDVLREARIMAALKPHYPYVPEVVALCDDPDVIGGDFYVMERLEGIIPRQDLPPELGMRPDETRRLCTNVLDRLIELHALDVEACGLGHLGRGAGYVGRQVEGWSERWRRAVSDGMDAMPDVLDWLARTTPAAETRICMIHNDYRFDNVVLAPRDPLAVIGVLDWEMATLGDPLMDLGGSLAYWIEADDSPEIRASRRQPTDAPGMLTRAQVIAYYAERSGLDVGQFDFYETFGLFRLAVIIQQIYRRFVLGQTTNRRFAQYGMLVEQLVGRCRASIAGSKL